MDFLGVWPPSGGTGKKSSLVNRGFGEEFMGERVHGL